MIDAQLRDQYLHACEQANYSLLRHPQHSMAEQLKQLAASVDAGDKPDTYGRSGVIEAFEQDVAQLLGKQNGLFLPTGTLAQPVALKLHSLKRNKFSIAMHPSSHLLLHEHRGIEKLWGLKVQQVGAPSVPFSLAELKAQCDSDTAALVFELPMREIGGELTDWEVLDEQIAWAKSQGIACHLDGARLWQVGAYYKRSLAEICALFDSVYVSFYKDLGGISGAMLLANKPLINEARIWARRAGGNPISLYPEVLAARLGLKENLPIMPEAVSYAHELGKMIAPFQDVQVTPQPPKAAMFHLRFPLSPNQLARKIADYVREQGVIILPLPRSGDDNHSICEIPVGRNAMSQPQDFWLRHFKAFIETLNA
ncbi:MAG: threonine aldolase [Idiomarina sp.]|nr:threonine aldolase [Idiomarina sp.]PHQ77432.1 MAG: threonine aldolase [Idiomarina sp.]